MLLSLLLLLAGARAVVVDPPRAAIEFPAEVALARASGDALFPVEDQEILSPALAELDAGAESAGAGADDREGRGRESGHGVPRSGVLHTDDERVGVPSMDSPLARASPSS